MDASIFASKKRVALCNRSLHWHHCLKSCLEVGNKVKDILVLVSKFTNLLFYSFCFRFFESKLNSLAIACTFLSSGLISSTSKKMLFTPCSFSSCVVLFGLASVLYTHNNSSSASAKTSSATIIDEHTDRPDFGRSVILLFIVKRPSTKILFKHSRKAKNKEKNKEISKLQN